jgi:HD-GYP domain-containing protein (c-di-GMP phosphodiesterase class II)
MLVEHDDAYTGLHTGEVLNLSVRVAEEMGLSESQTMLIESAAQLHDVGKIAVPSEIINKAGPLNEEEWEVIKTHTLKGQEMLSTIGGLMHTVGAVVRSCHERYDGQGYPDGLAGEAIPLESRVIFCCDAFNAMTTDRSYRRAMSVDAALDEVQRNAGTQFDPQVAAALQRCARPVPHEEPVRSGRLAYGRALRHPRPQTAAAGQGQSSVAA